MVTSSSRNWQLLKEKVSRLISEGEKLRKIHPDVYYEKARKWTPLKLILLMMYVDIYTKIMSKQRQKYQKMFYIDPLAGSGINKIKDTGDFLAGSPIISIVFARPLFDKYLFAEIDKKYRQALKERLKHLLSQERFEVHKDCNELLNKVANDIENSKESVHYLLFIDCEGMEVHWKSMQKILSYPGDVIFVFQTNEVWETIHRWRKHKTADSFFGNNDWRNATTPEDLLELYKNRIREVKTIEGYHRELIDDITIKGGRGPGFFHYNVIFATKKTRGGSPWYLKFIEYAKKKIEKYTGDAIKIALDIINGRSQQLDWFFPLTRPREPRHRTLNEYFP